MSIGRTILLKAADSKWIADQMSQRSFARRAVRKFMPGEALDDALVAAKTLATINQGSLITQLGEAIDNLSQADQVRDHYLDAFRQIKVRGLSTHISVKPSQLGIDQSLEACRVHLLALARAANEAGSALWLDMEDHTYVDRTIDLYRSIKAIHVKPGDAVAAKDLLLEFL